MKKAIVLLLVCLSTSNSRAQYHPFLNNSMWILHIYPFIGPDPFYATIEEGSDVIIGAYTYKKLYDPVFEEECYFREDVATQKVYKYVNGAERVEYDFSLQVGDQIYFENEIPYTVTAVTSTTVADGTSRKVIHLQSWAYDENWVEGMGSYSDPLVSHRVYSEPEYSISCFYQNGVYLYSSYDANCELLLDTATNQPRTLALKLAPNPFSTQFKVYFEEKITNGTVKMYNALGQLVKEIHLIQDSEITIDRGNLCSGIYTIQVMEKDKVIANRKVMLTEH